MLSTLSTWCFPQNKKTGCNFFSVNRGQVPQNFDKYLLINGKFTVACVIYILRKEHIHVLMVSSLLLHLCSRASHYVTVSCLKTD